MVTQRRQVVCPNCGAVSVGIQTECLLCHAPLSAAEAPAVPVPTQRKRASPARTAQKRTAPRAAQAPKKRAGAPQQQTGARFCTQCGTPLKQGARFCSNCGQRS